MDENSGTETTAHVSDSPAGRRRGARGLGGARSRVPTPADAYAGPRRIGRIARRSGGVGDGAVPREGEPDPPHRSATPARNALALLPAGPHTEQRVLRALAPVRSPDHRRPADVSTERRRTREDAAVAIVSRAHDALSGGVDSGREPVLGQQPQLL